MRLHEVIWKERFVENIADKHSVTIEEVEGVLFSRPHVRKAEKGRIKGEDLYVAYGQTDAAGIWLCSSFANAERLHHQFRPVI